MSEENTIQEILQRLVKLETLIETKLSSADKRIDKIEETISWLWKTALGAIILAGISLIINK